VVKATFKNPYDRSRGRWGYGFFFRAENRTFLSVSVDSDKSFSLETGGLTRTLGISQELNLYGKFLSEFDRSEGGTNVLTLLVYSDTATLLVNDYHVATLKTSPWNLPGKVSIAGYQANPIEGSVIEYEDFIVWSISPAVVRAKSGKLQHNAGTVDIYDTGILAGNAILRAQFTNPPIAGRETWSYGMLIRDSLSSKNSAMRLILSSNGTWALHSGIQEPIARGEFPPTVGFRLNLGASNTVKILALGTRGYLFVNDVFVSMLDLSSSQELGTFKIGAKFYTTDRAVAGESTEYANLDFILLP
jgi:hypothetical protein